MVTVLMSVYNSEEFLCDAIDSILNQTFSDFEFIIIDDGSKDDSINIVEKYALSDPRILFIKNPVNIGLAASLNVGILLAKGKYIARQDADDISALNRLELQTNYALKNAEVDIVGSNCFIIDIKSDTVYEDRVYGEDKNFFNKLLNREAIFPHGSAFMKKEKITECGMYDKRFYYVQDGELWLRALSCGANIFVMDKSLYYYRVTPVSSSKRKQVKTMFNKVLKMIYYEQQNADMIDYELKKVNSYLSSVTTPVEIDYMADYWKSLGNAAYLNKASLQTSLKYIAKAIKENQSILNYPKYFLLALVYCLPVNCVNFFIKNRI